MAAMKRTILVLSVLWVLAGTVPASAAVLGENLRLGESFPNAGIEQAAGDVSRELLPGSGGSCLVCREAYYNSVNRRVPRRTATSRK